MVDCLSYVSSGSTVSKAEGTCCSGLKTVLKSKCLCEAFKNSAPFGVSLNVTKALALASACKISAPSVSNCGEFLYGNKFTIEEMQDIKLMIQSNMYKYLSIILDGRERFEEETMPRKKSIGPHDQVTEAGGEVDSNENIQCVYSINPIGAILTIKNVYNHERHDV